MLFLSNSGSRLQYSPQSICRIGNIQYIQSPEEKRKIYRNYHFLSRFYINENSTNYIHSFLLLNISNMGQDKQFYFMPGKFQVVVNETFGNQTYADKYLRKLRHESIQNLLASSYNWKETQKRVDVTCLFYNSLLLVHGAPIQNNTKTIKKKYLHAFVFPGLYMRIGNVFIQAKSVISYSHNRLTFFFGL